MNLELIKSGNPKGGAQVQADVPVGRYGGFLIVVKGTTDTDETLSIDDLGKFRLRRYNDQWQGETLDWYHRLNDIKGGYPRSVTPTAGDSRISTLIPVGLPGVPNSMDVLTKEEVDLFIDFDAVLDTRFGANNAKYEIWGVLQPGVPETYALMVQEQDVDASGTGPRDGVFNSRNIGAVYFEDVDDVVDSIFLQVDDQVVCGTVDDEVLLDMTNIAGRIEASGNDLVEAYSISSSNVEEAINETTKYKIQFSGPGRAALTLMSVSLDVDAEGSIERVREFLFDKFGSAAGVPGARSSVPRGAIPA